MFEQKNEGIFWKALYILQSKLVNKKYKNLPWALTK